MSEGYHFIKSKPDDQLLADIASADRLENQIFAEFAQLVFQLLTQSSKAAQMLEQIEEFASEQEINDDAVKKMTKAWLTFLKAAQKLHLTPQFVKEDLIKIGLDSKKASFLAKQFKANLVAMSRAVVGRTLMVNQLVDMEWRFGVAAGSSEVKTAGNTFLQIKMSLDKGSKVEDVYMELTLPQFYDFLHQMEKAKSSLEYLS